MAWAIYHGIEQWERVDPMRFREDPITGRFPFAGDVVIAVTSYFLPFIPLHASGEGWKPPHISNRLPSTGFSCTD